MLLVFVVLIVVYFVFFSGNTSQVDPVVVDQVIARYQQALNDEVTASDASSLASFFLTVQEAESGSLDIYVPFTTYNEARPYLRAFAVEMGISYLELIENSTVHLRVDVRETTGAPRPNTAGAEDHGEIEGMQQLIDQLEGNN